MKFNNIIIFDGLCNLCNTFVQFIIRIDQNGIFKFTPMQSETAGEIFKQYKIDFKNMDTVILLKNNTIFYQSDAVLEIVKALKYPWKAFYFFKFIPKFIRDGIYNVIASNRYTWFGKRDSCMIPTEDIKSRFLD
jgi:predicted DCC family thiol-disulfide oxidoreductase YuxK